MGIHTIKIRFVDPFIAWCWSVPIMILMLSGGCGDGSSDGPVADVEEALRIVTLSPAITQMVIDLGYGDQIVGVAEQDYSIQRTIPTIGHFLNVNLEELVRISPTHVLMVCGWQDVPDRLRLLAEEEHFQLAAYDYPDTIEDVACMLANMGDSELGDDRISLGEALGCLKRAESQKLEFEKGFDCLQSITSDFIRPRVLLVIAVNPVMACGSGTVHDELLAYIGARNAAEASRLTAPVFDKESLIAMQPEIILLLLPKSPPLSEDDMRLASFRDLPIPAVQEGRIYLINDPLVLLPSTSLLDCALKMARVVHPGKSTFLDSRYETCITSKQTTP